MHAARNPYVYCKPDLWKTVDRHVRRRLLANSKQQTWTLISLIPAKNLQMTEEQRSCMTRASTRTLSGSINVHRTVGLFGSVVIIVIAVERRTASARPRCLRDGGRRGRLGPARELDDAVIVGISSHVDENITGLCLIYNNMACQ